MSTAPPPNELPPPDLAADTAVTPLAKAPGWYTANLPPTWDFETPSGGVLMTAALRAMQHAVGDETLRPVSANTLFMSPVPHGPLEVRVEVLRRGGAAAQLRAALSSTTMPGPGLEVSATFARDREGPSYTDAVMPEVPPPPDCPDENAARDGEGLGSPPFFRCYDLRRAFGTPWMEDWKAAPNARFGRWFRHLVPQYLPDGRLDPLVIPPVADNMPPAVAAKLGPEQMFFAPSLDLTVHFLDDTSAEWLLVEVASRWCGRGYATADVNVWAEDGTLVAYATQTMIIRRPKPEWVAERDRFLAHRHEGE